MTDETRPLRILQVNTKYGVGGITRHVLELSAWMRAQGHQMFFAGTPGVWLGPDHEPRFVSIEVLKATGEGANIVSRVGHLLGAALRLRGWLNMYPVDVIHAHDSAPALIARLASWGKGIPVMLTYHGSEPERVGQYAAMAKFAADRVVSVSRRSGRDLVEKGELPEARLRVIGLGVKPIPPADPARQAALRRELLGADGRVLVTTIARICDQKGIDILIEVVRRVMAERPDIRFALVGDGPQEAEAKGWAVAAGVTSHLTFVGRSEEPHLYLRAADIFLLTSRWEALPFTIAEAFQAGTPAIATDCGGVAELIDDAVGRVVSVGDAAAIAAAVIAVADDDAGRAAMAAAALARSGEDRFSPAHIHKLLETQYRELADGRR